jgi:hypothetical protein
MALLPVTGFLAGSFRRFRLFPTPTGARMGGIVDARQVLKIQMGVDLGGTEIGVAEQFLHGAQVAAGFE